jgi:hypothetical protein
MCRILATQKSAWFRMFAHTLNLTDIHTTWTESRAVLGGGEEAVQRALDLDEIAVVLPFRLLGVDSDNGSKFINGHLKGWCEQKDIQLTRGRPYKKDLGGPPVFPRIGWRPRSGSNRQHPA